MCPCIGDYGKSDYGKSDYGKSDIGKGDYEWLKTAGHLANVQRDLGMLDDAMTLREEMMPILRRTHGENDSDTLQCRVQVVRLLACQGKLREAREKRDALFPVVARVMGPDNHLTQRLLHPDFLTAPRH